MIGHGVPSFGQSLNKSQLHQIRDWSQSNKYRRKRSHAPITNSTPEDKTSLTCIYSVKSEAPPLNSSCVMGLNASVSIGSFWVNLRIGSNFFSDSTLNFHITHVRSFLSLAYMLRSSCECFAIFWECDAVDWFLGGFGRLGNNITGFSIIDNKYIRDDNE